MTGGDVGQVAVGQVAVGQVVGGQQVGQAACVGHVGQEDTE